MKTTGKLVFVSILVLFIAIGTVLACAAITKNGTQCKRAPQAGSIYCWQHARMYGNTTNSTPSESQQESSSSVATNNSNYVDQSNNVQQCQAITKKGTQCKRKAVSGSNYCWQHSK